MLDFGIARLAPTKDTTTPELGVTRTGQLVGTPAYMAPEQCTGAGRVEGQADVYALGVMLYEMLGGGRPFVPEHPVEVMSMHIRELPPSLEARAPGTASELSILVDQMLAKHPAQRPTMPEVADALRRLLGDRATAAGDRAMVAAAVGANATEPLQPTLAASAEACPFVVGPPIAQPERFFGRQRVLRRLASLWRRPPLQNAAILGARRSGKTSLLLHLKSHVASLPASSWSGGRPPRFFYLDLQDPRLGSRDVLLRHLLRGLGSTPPRRAGRSPSSASSSRSPPTCARPR